ncbi:MAG: MBL fold metallo-hydrolase [Lewinellaceae bacterium]|nr:MBL fold metallo-hydrolase [Lewinellaceae bacterium]
MLWLIWLSLFLSTHSPAEQQPFLVVLGTAQDAGYPQADCRKSCCTKYWNGEQAGQHVVSLGLVDPSTDRIWMIDATPDFRDQLRTLQGFRSKTDAAPLDGIFLTHAHIGHYTGLMHLGREVIGSKQVPVYAMPRMRSFLEANGPWNQLVQLQNIDLQPMQADSAVLLSSDFSVTPILVPHRDEYSETVGFLIRGPNRSVLFIPDIDKWEKWDRDIIEAIKKVDVAFLDGTFYQDGELPGRNMNEIPHPFIQESMELFKDLPASEKSKIHFIHFNHTNPVIFDAGAREAIEKKGYHCAFESQRILL